MPHKTFGKKTQDEALDIEPISFDLAGEENLVCRSQVNGKLLLDLMRKVESGSVANQADGILSIFSIALLRDDGEAPEDYTGRPYDVDRPLEHHTQAELNTAREEGVTPGIDPTSSLGRVQAVLDDPDTAIDINDLAELVGYIVEGYTAGRPTSKSGGSRTGTGSTSRTSGRARRPRATTSDAPTLESVST